MNDTELYRLIVGLDAPWQIIDVELDIDEESVRVFVGCDPQREAFACPQCGAPSRVYDHREQRSWRHLDSCQFKTYLVCSLPRVSCSEHGVQTVDASWCEPKSRFTALYERFAIAVLQATGVQSRAATLLRLSAGQVHDLMDRAVVRGLARRDSSETLRHLSLDEKSFQQGHHYITVLGDSQGKRVLDVAEGRTLEGTRELLTGVLSEEQRAQVESVSMDMWAGFMGAREQVLPGADTVHDRFHVSGYLNDAVDRTRRTENREHTKQKDTVLNKTKYLWLKNEENLTDKQRADIEGLRGLELETAKVWAFKENFRQFFACRTVYGAYTFFHQWYDAAVALGNVHLTKVADMLKNHLEGLLAYIRHRVTNAIAEGMNAQIQQIKAQARGFRRFHSFRTAILFFLGKLDLNPQESP
jgi:transposase